MVNINKEINEQLKKVKKFRGRALTSREFILKKGKKSDIFLRVPLNRLGKPIFTKKKFEIREKESFGKFLTRSFEFAKPLALTKNKKETLKVFNQIEKGTFR